MNGITSLVMVAGLVLGGVVALAAAGDPPAPAQTVLRTVDANGDAVAGATVCWRRVEPAGDGALDDGWDGAWSWIYAEDDLAAREARVRGSGLRATTGADGRVTLPAAEVLEVVGERDGLWGIACTIASELGRERGSNQETELVLLPTADLTVRVVDLDGAPAAGVPVALRTKVHSPRNRMHATTGADGTAVLRHARYLLAEDGRYRDGEGCVALDLCVARDVEAPLDPGAWPDEPVTLTLPPTGELEVVVSEADGSPCALEREVAISRVGEDVWKDGELVGSTWVSSLDGGVPPGVACATAEGGRALFRYVGLDQELVALAKRNGASKTVAARGRGPTRPGERARLDVTLGVEEVSLRGWLVDEHGSPLVSLRSLAELFSGPSGSRVELANRLAGDYLRTGSGTLHSDGAGRFRLDYDAGAVHAGRPLLVLTHARNEPGVHSTRIDLSDAWRAGPHALGDVALPPAPVLAAGTVVDDLGQPIAGVQVAAVQDRGGWSRLVQRTDAEGSFALRSAEPDVRAISFEKRGYVSRSHRDTIPASEDLAITLFRAGRIEGRVLLPPGLTHRDVSVGSIMVDREGEGVAPAGYSPRPDGTFAREDLLPGDYRVGVRSAGAELVERTVTVRAGETTSLELEVPGSVRAVEVQVLDPQGAPLRQGYYVVRASGGTSPWDPWTEPNPSALEGGRLRVTTSEPSIDLTVVAPGLRLAHVEDVQDGIVVRLERGLAVEIALSRPVGEPPEGWELVLGLAPASARGRHGYMGKIHVESGPFDDSGKATVLVPAPGTYHPRWMVRRRQADGYESRYWPAPPERSIEVREVEGGLVWLEPTIDPESIDPGWFD